MGTGIAQAPSPILIETDRANLAPVKLVVSTQAPYGILMPQSGRRPQHQTP
jgi:hypothetical protein